MTDVFYNYDHAWIFQVSTSWSRVIKDCNGYWKSLCECSGLSGEILKKEKRILGGYREVACRLLQQEHWLANNLALMEIKFHEPNPTIAAGYTLIDPVCNGFCLQVEKTVNPVLTLLKNEGGTVCEVAKVSNIFPHGFLEVLWSISSADGVLLLGNNGMWVEFLVPADKSGVPPTVTEWQGGLDTLSSPIYYKYSKCRNCRLILAVRSVMSRDSFWTFHVTELHKNPTIIHYCKAIKKFLPETVPPTSYNLVVIKKVHVYPCTPCSPSCNDHIILVQFGSVVVKFVLKRIHESNFEISGPQQVFMPYSDPSFYIDQGVLGTFALSHNEDLIAVMERNNNEGVIRSHIWNVDLKGDPVVVTNSSDAFVRAECIAIGHLYQLVILRSRTSSKVCVQRVVTEKGTRAFSITLQDPATISSHDMFPWRLSASSIHVCDEQEWLNSISGWSKNAQSGLLCMAVGPPLGWSGALGFSVCSMTL